MNTSIMVINISQKRVHAYRGNLETSRKFVLIDIKVTFDILDSPRIKLLMAKLTEQ